jgi:hypothetical protein
MKATTRITEAPKAPAGYSADDMLHNVELSQLQGQSRIMEDHNNQTGQPPSSSGRGNIKSKAMLEALHLKWCRRPAGCHRCALPKVFRCCTGRGTGWLPPDGNAVRTCPMRPLLKALHRALSAIGRLANKIPCVSPRYGTFPSGMSGSPESHPCSSEPCSPEGLSQGEPCMQNGTEDCP